MKLLIVDSHKAWSVTTGCLIINGLMIGFIKIYSLIIIEYQELLNAPMSILMFGTSMLISLIGLVGPLSIYLSERFTSWKSGLLASFLASTSILIMAFAYNIYIQLLSVIILGISFSILYIPAISILGKCHIKHQSLSQGIVKAGASFGTLIMPLGFSELINMYSIRGVMIIMSGFMFHLAIAAALIPTHIIELKDGYKPILVSIQDRKRRLHGETIKIYKWDVSVTKYLSKSNFKWPPRELWSTLFLYIIGTGNVMNGYMLLSGLYGAFARSLSLTVTTSAYLLMIQSCVDLVTRLTCGYLIDLKLIPRWLLYCINAFILCFFSVLVGIFPSVSLFYFYLFCNAIFGAFLMVLADLVLIDAIGLDYISASFTINIFVQGGMAVIVFYAIGFYCDVTGKYNYAILFCGLKIGFGATVIVLERIFRRFYFKRK